MVPLRHRRSRICSSQSLSALGDLAQQGGGLGVEQVPVPCDQDGVLGTVDGVPGPPDPHAFDSVERLQPVVADRQQFGVLAGHERADKAIEPFLECGEIGGRVVALVEDHGDVFAVAGEQFPPACRERVEQAGEGRRVRPVSRIDAVQHRQAAVGSHEQGEADDAQRLAALLAVAALREGRPVVEAVDEGEEVAGIERHLPQIDRKPVDHGGDDVALDIGDGGLRTRSMLSQNRWLVSCRA